MEVKFWVLNREDYDGIRPITRAVYATKHDAIEGIQYHIPVHSIQQVEICSDRLLLMMLKAYQTSSWQQDVRDMIRHNDVNCKLHPSIPLK